MHAAITSRIRVCLCLIVCLIFIIVLEGRGAASIPTPTSFVLPNGLRVLVASRRANPLVAIDLWVKAGAREERTEEHGCAHFLEHTLFKGTGTRAAGDIDLAMENLGATLDAATGPDYVHFYTTVTPEHFAVALDIIADVVRNATLPADEIEAERGVILDELAAHSADPIADIVDSLYETAFDKHPYKRSPGGSPMAIAACTRAAMTAFYHRCYRPSNCTLVIVGDCATDRATAAVKHAFADWSDASGQTSRSQPSFVQPSRPQPFQSQSLQSQSVESHPVTNKTPLLSNTLSAEPELNPARVYRSTAPDTKEISKERISERIGIGFAAPAANDRTMTCAAMVAAVLLGDPRHGGRLASDRFVGSEATALYTPRQDGSLFIITAVIPPADANHTSASDRIEQLKSSLMDAVQALHDAPPSASELAEAQSWVLGRMQFDMETNAGLARSIGYADIINGDDPIQMRRQILNLTPAVFKKFVTVFLNPSHCITILPAAPVDLRGTP